jgi:hypothetical protein
MTLRAPLALVAAVVSASCAASLTKLPVGPGVPADDAAGALAQALAACQRVNTLSAELTVSGHVGRQRLRGRLVAGLIAPATAYLEAPAPFGSPVFILSANGDDATLLLPRDQRVLEHGRSTDVFEAIAGVPLSPPELRATLTGCAVGGGSARAERAGDDWRIIHDDSAASDLYLRRERSDAPWQLVAVIRRGSTRTWRVDYRDFVRDLPRGIRLTSSDAPALDVRLGLSQIEVNGPLDPATLRVRIPAGTAPITIDELRKSGPLAERTSSSDE